MWVEWEGPIAADERVPSVLRAAEAAAAISAICSVERYRTVYIYDLEPGFQTLTLGGPPLVLDPWLDQPASQHVRSWLGLQGARSFP